MALPLHTRPHPNARTTSPVGYYASFSLSSAVRYCLALLADRPPAPRAPARRTVAPAALPADM